MPLACPYCNSSRFFKAGFRVTRRGERIQRYLCRVCGRRFSLSPRLKVELNVSSQIVEVPNPGLELAETPSVNTPTLEPSLDEPPLPMGENVGSHNVSRVGESLNTLYSYSRNSREKESKKHPPADEPEMNLVTNEAMSVLVQQPGTAQDSRAKEVEGRLVEFAWWLKKQGKAEATIKNYVVMLRLLLKHGAKLDDPESVKDILAKNGKSEGWKVLAVKAYSSFLSMMGKTWIPPKFKVTRPLPFIPLESELEALIAGCGPKLSVLLQLLKETGMRIGEALRLTWKDVDMERRVIILNEPEKNSNPRIFRVSPKLVGMLNTLPKTNEKLFPACYGALKANFEAQRRKLAKKLNNPRLLNITFHTFRHWRATMEYHKTKDILHVKELLGHKDIENTMLYIQVEKALFGSQDDEFTVKVAKSPDEVKELLETGFEYVCEKDNLMFFRKRK